MRGKRREVLGGYKWRIDWFSPSEIAEINRIVNEPRSPERCGGINLLKLFGITGDAAIAKCKELNIFP